MPGLTLLAAISSDIRLCGQCMSAVVPCDPEAGTRANQSPRTSFDGVRYCCSTSFSTVQLARSIDPPACRDVIATASVCRSPFSHLLSVWWLLLPSAEICGTTYNDYAEMVKLDSFTPCVPFARWRDARWRAAPGIRRIVRRGGSLVRSGARGSTHSLMLAPPARDGTLCGEGAPHKKYPANVAKAA